MTGAEHLKFLYPSSRQYPFDTVVESIVRELGARGWECPALQELQVDFKSYGDSEHGFFKVSKISARDFSLEFERCQGRLGHGGWNNTAAVSRLQIPGAELKVYDDESGPLYFQYGGSDWDRDREKFMDLSKIVNDVARNRTLYVRYEGRLDSEGRFYALRGQRPQYLVLRELAKVETFGMPTSLKVSHVLEEFRMYLEEKVLASIVGKCC